MTRNRLHLLSITLAAALLLAAAASARAADWQLVLSDAGRKIEIDRASIFDSDRGTKVSWGRVVLSDAEAEKAGYRTVKALNRYDCRNNSFFTIKRVYLDIDERVLREESVADQNPVVVTKGSVDERMWREVCKPPGVADLAKIADAASQSAAAVNAEPKPVPVMPPVVAAPTKPLPAATKVDAPPPVVPPSVTPKSAAEASKPITTPKQSPAEALLKEREAAADAAAASPMPTPAAPPIPSIRPNLAGLVEKTAPIPAKAEVAPAPPKPASDTKPITQPKAPEVKAPPPRTRVEAPAPAPRPRATPTPRPRPAAERKSTKAAPSAAEKPRPAPSIIVETLKGDGWSYAGETGPENWGKLRPDWKICSEGKRQSPINLQNGVAVDLDPVKFEYRATQFRTTDTGNVLRVAVGDGMSMEVRGKRYALEYLTLHRPSQERVGGGASDMVVHFHHRAADGQIAIVGVLVERQEQSNPMLQTVLNNLPLEKGNTYMPDDTIDLAAFMPSKPEHYLYMGSLTTPPCTEGVMWVVMKQPVGLSQDQLDIFNRLYPRNSRPIQPANGRLILESR